MNKFLLKSVVLVFMFAAVSFAQPRVWAPMEFTYKTVSAAPMCDLMSEELRIAFRTVVLNEDPIAVDRSLLLLKEHEGKSPEAVYALRMLIFFEHIDQDIIEKYGFDIRHDYEYLAAMLPLTGDFPALAENIIISFLTGDLLNTTYSLEGERIYPNIYGVIGYKDYICELKYRGCGDFTDVIDIDCNQ